MKAQLSSQALLPVACSLFLLQEILSRHATAFSKATSQSQSGSDSLHCGHSQQMKGSGSWCSLCGLLVLILAAAYLYLLGLFLRDLVTNGEYDSETGCYSVMSEAFTRFVGWVWCLEALSTRSILAPSVSYTQNHDYYYFFFFEMAS